MSHIPSFPQEYWSWELMGRPWLTKCSQSSTFWFSASSSSLASLKETFTTGSSQNRTTNWTHLDPLTPIVWNGTLGHSNAWESWCRAGDMVETKRPRLPWWFSCKESACQCQRPEFDPWVGKIPWRRKWQPTLVFLLGISYGQRSLEGYSPGGCKRGRTWLSDKTTETWADGSRWWGSRIHGIKGGVQ